MWGGGGADVFVFSRRHGADQIRDFTPGLDLIDASDLPLRWSTLEITGHKGGSLVDTGADEIWLKGVKPDQLEEADFIF